MKTAGTILGAILLVGLFLGCSLTERDFSLKQVDPPDNKKGVVTIVFNWGLFLPKTLTPGMEISTYDIQGTLEGGGDGFQSSVEVDEPFSQSGLTPGDWTITVDAKNEDGITIGRGGTTANITAGSNTSVQIQISPLSGDGTLELTVQWPKHVFDTDAIAATLTPAITPNGILDFTIDKHALINEGKYSNEAVPAGYYLLTLRLIGDGVPVWGIAEAVRILAGATTSQTYNYTPPN